MKHIVNAAVRRLVTSIRACARDRKVPIMLAQDFGAGSVLMTLSRGTAGGHRVSTLQAIAEDGLRGIGHSKSSHPLGTISVKDQTVLVQLHGFMCSATPKLCNDVHQILKLGGYPVYGHTKTLYFKTEHEHQLEPLAIGFGYEKVGRDHPLMLMVPAGMSCYTEKTEGRVLSFTAKEALPGFDLVEEPKEQKPRSSGLDNIPIMAPARPPVQPVLHVVNAGVVPSTALEAIQIIEKSGQIGPGILRIGPDYVAEADEWTVRGAFKCGSVWASFSPLKEPLPGSRIKVLTHDAISVYLYAHGRVAGTMDWVPAIPDSPAVSFNLQVPTNHCGPIHITLTETPNA